VSNAHSILAAIAVAMVPFAASAVELPAAFLGTWRIANPSDNQCRKDDVKGAAEGHMIVTPGAVEHHEFACRIVGVRRLNPPDASEQDRINVDVNIACKGEGMLWSAREIWHSETIDGRRIAAVTSFGQTNHRDERGRKQKGPSLITTSIYYPCR
jgi:hypothetical protein